jgi:RNA polymerase sigma factor (sigma-70 family)
MKGEEINLSNVQIDKPIGEDGDNTIGDIMLRTDFDDPFENEETNRVLTRLLSKLRPTDLEIVQLFYGLVGDGLSTKEIAEQVGKTPAEVNRALKVARAQMRKEISK